MFKPWAANNPPIKSMKSQTRKSPTRSRTKNMEQFATASDGAPLHWIVSTPVGDPPWPGVLGIHGGGFKQGSPNTPNRVCAADLVAAGYAVFCPEYRLAPPGRIVGQVSKGQFPDQTDDILLSFNAAKTDKRCNGSLQAVGGSGGGYQVCWLVVHDLCSGVAMSPATKLDDPQSLADGNFGPDCNNYAPGKLTEASPYTYAHAGQKAVFLLAYTTDPMPAPQYDLFDKKLVELGAEHTSLLLPGAGHSFAMWPTIKTQAIAFLDAHK
jgi:acetyl esterase/lipase